MAIKGKKKPKARSPRAVTPGPRRAVYVQPKVPLFQRTGAKFLVALIAEAVVFALLVGFGEQSRTTRQQEQVTEFTSLVDASLGRAGDAIQPFAGGAQVLPGLPSRLSQLEGEEPLGEEVVIPEADLWISSLGRAADGVSAVQVPVQDLSPEQRLALTEARSLMDQALRLFIGLAEQLKVAIRIEGEPQADLVASMQEQLVAATGTFNAGYGKLLGVRNELGLSTTPSLPGGGVPGGVAPPGFDPTMPLIPPEEIPVDVGGGGGNGGGGQGGGGGNG